MEETDLLAENIIKVEEIKEEHADNEEDYCWNSIAKDEPSDSLHSVKEEDNKDDEELEPPLAVFVQPLEEQEGVCIEETKINTAENHFKPQPNSNPSEEEEEAANGCQRIFKDDEAVSRDPY
ncbi:Protein of unknown function [Gryllus bimaculatus]|nr:Protein of unknown function [Gryllus bimaculatus]